MAKTRASFRCRSCGAAAPKWMGRCPDCGEWDALHEVGPRADRAGRPAGGPALRLVPDDPVPDGLRPTGVGELDRVLGGGLASGSVLLLGGAPGIGKSTLMLQALAGLARSGLTGLLVSAEESARQVQARARRVGAEVDGVSVLAETDLPSILDAVSDLAPDVVVLDSVHTVTDPSTSGGPGSVPQVQGAAAALAAVARRADATVLLVGHVTKDGSLAGPRSLEHLVDTVMAFEGDRDHDLRTLRVRKHRFGPTGEVGVVRMAPAGLEDVDDPSSTLLADRRPGAPGSVVAAVVEGSRPLLLEVQALAVPTRSPSPRRSVQGADPKRVALLLAVLEGAGVASLATCDVFVNIAGGVRVREPGADLPIALALAGTAAGLASHHGQAAWGEVGLSGEIRGVSHGSSRANEAFRLGFGGVIAPPATIGPAGLAVTPVATVEEALAAAGLAPVGYPRPDSPCAPTGAPSRRGGR